MIAFKRIVVALTLVGLLFGSVSSTYAGGFGYTNTAYPTYPPQPSSPVLKQVLIGAGLVGAGYLLGRATAPQVYPVYNAPPVRVGPQFGYGQPWQQANFYHDHHGPMPMYGRPF